MRLISLLGPSLCKYGICVKYSYAPFYIILFAVLVFFITRKTFVRFRTEDEKRVFNRQTRFLRIFFMISRIVAFFFLLIAVSTPYYTKTEINPGIPSITLLSDNSSSFGLFEENIANNLRERLSKQIPTKIRTIASEERSAIGDGILANIAGDDNLLLITDGNNNHGRDLTDIVYYAATLNTTISVLDVKPNKNDVRVAINGPFEVIEGSKAFYEIDIQKAGAPGNYKLQVFLDGKLIKEDDNAETQTIEIDLGMGFHKLSAKLIGEDFFPQNNEFFKTIKVVEKPKILFISDDNSPLYKGISGLYDVKLEKAVPNDIKGYDSVIINNIPEKDLQKHITKLSDFTADGNGVIFVGGQNSFDNGGYKDSLLETMLPVDIGAGKIIEDVTHNIVFLLDTSESFRYMEFSESGIYSPFQVAKESIVNLIQKLRSNINVGIVVFYAKSTIMSPIKSMEHREELIEIVKNIRQLQATNLLPGLKNAEYLLEKVKGNKNIIIFSDGDIITSPSMVIPAIKKLAAKGIRVYTVGIGENTRERFMMDMARAGNGLFFKQSESNNLNIIFGEPEADEKVLKGTTNLVILDDQHFITSKLDLNARVTGVNFVVPKPMASLLVVTNENYPVLTTWYFGLGRIAVISTDDGRKWSGSLLDRESSRMLTRTINWAIGDLARKRSYDVSIKDTTIGKNAEIKVIANDAPKAEGLNFGKVGPRLYVANKEFETAGFKEILNTPFAINYNDEYLNLGFNELLYSLATLTKGKVFKPEDEIAEDIKTMSVRVKTETINMRWPFILAGLCVLLFEIALRRIKQKNL